MSTGDAGLGELQPLNARSLALSALLGTHPPRLPARALVALGELFGIAAGTMRVALSRLAANGDLDADDAWYRLTGPLLDRQQTQDLGREPPPAEWDGTWHTVVALDDRRPTAERRRFRRRLTDHRFGELRPDIWMRPANLPPPPGDDAWLVTTGVLSSTDQPALAARLWDLDALAGAAHRLRDRLDDTATEADDPFATIPRRFEAAAAALRLLRSDPLLPAEVSPDDWPFDELRHTYAATERELQSILRAFFRHATADVTPTSGHDR